MENAENQTEIASVMAELGYDNAEITEGKALLVTTRQAYDFNQTEDEAYEGFSSVKSELESTYRSHRKKAKVVFRKDSLTMDKLSISGSIPQAFVRLLEKAKKFYSTAGADEDIQSKLARLQISAEDITAGGKLITDVEAARALYLREKGESQDATKVKDAAFAKPDQRLREELTKPSWFTKKALDFSPTQKNKLAQLSSTSFRFVLRQQL